MKKILLAILFAIISCVAVAQEQTKDVKITKTIDDRVMKIELENFFTDTVYINMYSEESCVIESAVINPGKYHVYKLYIKYVDEHIDCVEIESKDYHEIKHFE